MSKLLKNNWLAKFPLATVFLFTFICLLPEMLMRDFTTSNELRYLSIADESIVSDSLFTFYNHGVPYADKPPLYLWLVTTFKLLLGKHSMFALSLLSLLPAFITTWVMDRWVMAKAPATHRMAMAMVLLTSVMFLGTMVVIRMDMMMCMFIVVALFIFWQMYEMNYYGELAYYDVPLFNMCSWLLPVFIFLALFTKGPVGLLVPLLSILVFLIVERRWRDIGTYLGWKTWGVIAGLSAAWFLGVYLDGGREYLDNLLFNQTVGRAINAFTHSRPFWFYAVALLWCIAPYTLLLLGSVVVSAWPRKSASTEIPVEEVRSDKEKFFLCVIATTFVMLSSFSSKLPVYLVPMFPFIAYLFPLVVSRTRARRWMAWAIGIPAGVLAVAGLAAIAVLSGIVNVPALDAVRSEYPFAFANPVKIAAVLLVLGNLLALWFLFRRREWALPVFMMGSSLLLMIYSASGVIVQANPYIGYKDVCREVPVGTDVETLFMHRPENMDVYLGKQIKDYDKDVDMFLYDATVPYWYKHITLIMPERKLEEFPDLRKFVYDSARVTYSGPYCVATFKPRKRPELPPVVEGAKLIYYGRRDR